MYGEEVWLIGFVVLLPCIKYHDLQTSVYLYVWGKGMADRFCCRVLNIMTCRHQSTCMYGEKGWLIGFVAVY